jgi:hypothetical protein
LIRGLAENNERISTARQHRNWSAMGLVCVCDVYDDAAGILALSVQQRSGFIERCRLS